MRSLGYFALAVALMVAGSWVIGDQGFWWNVLGPAAYFVAGMLALIGVIEVRRAATVTA